MARPRLGAPPSRSTDGARLTDLDARVASTTVDDIVTLTQAAYDALPTKVSTTLYVIVG